MAPRGCAPDQSNISVCHERASDSQKTESGPFDAHTTAHLLKWLHGPLRDSVHATGQAAKLHASRAAIHACANCEA
eukprot:1772746-Pleurochrysis_carterae.AAC.1